MTDEQRRHALEEAAWLVERHIAPAAPFDVQGEEVPGLTLGLLERRFPDLDDPPDEAEFAAALEEQGVDVRDPAELLRAWTAQRAARRLREIVTRLRDTPPVALAQADLERMELTRLLDAPLPALDRTWIELTLRRMRR